MDARGVEVEVVASGRDARTSSDGGVLLHVEKEFARPGGVPLAPGVVGRARQGFDLIHVHSPNPTGEFAALRVRTKTAVVFTFHADTDRGGVVGPVYRRWLTRALDRADRVIVASGRLVESSPVLRGLKERENVSVIPFGVDTDRFSPSDRGPARRWGDEPVVLFLGRLRYYKGLTQLVDALTRSRARLVVIGDGPERRTIEERGRSLLGDRFIYLPGIDESEIVDAYRSADLFCLPSTSPAEAFGISVLEAMACGLPAITTELGTATSEINVDGETGRVVPPRDSRRLAAAIDTMIEDPSERMRMGAAARERVLAHFRRDLMLDRIKAVYDGVVADRKLRSHG